MSRRPKIVDAFPFNDELDMLECRLVELDGVVDHFVIVEADVTHQGAPKPLHFADNRERFAAWSDRIIHVVASDMPTDPNPWSREHEQRERIAEGLAHLDLDQFDIVLQSDCDEIPRTNRINEVRPFGLTVFGMRFHPFAVDWVHPEVWFGTVAASVRTLRQMGDKPFAKMRHSRFSGSAPNMRDAGWHFTWVGGRDYAKRKLEAFAHPEIAPTTSAGIDDDHYRREGWHVDGTKLRPVDVDASWPKWIVDGHAPAEWFRPR